VRKAEGDVPVLFSSGYTSDIIHQKGILEEGMNFISKPVSPQRFLLTIQRGAFTLAKEMPKFRIC
jgi:CheY-like chemotaxis protein